VLALIILYHLYIGKVDATTLRTTAMGMEHMFPRITYFTVAVFLLPLLFLLTNALRMFVFTMWRGPNREIGLKFYVAEAKTLLVEAANGALNLYDGKLRLMAPEGTFEEFPYDRYTDYIAEHVESWSYLKFPYAKKWGSFSMDLEHPSGIYRSNTLARMNVCEFIDTPLAQAELEEFRRSFGRPAQLTLLYHWARLIELLYNSENAMRLLNDPEITSLETRVKVEPRAARGVGSVEAPRGTLIHDYETDADGMVTSVNLIVGTTHNNAPINMSVTQAAKTRIHNGEYDQGVMNTIEMAIRAYDPCLSCATHRLDGLLFVKVDIVDARGRLLDSFAN
jgi:F420-non-reducing hydrogenase large subunit